MPEPRELQTGPVTPEDDALPNPVVPPIIQQACDAFQAALPQLLKERPGQWVAYRGDRQLGFGRTRQELYDRFLPQGFVIDELLVLKIWPDVPWTILGPREPA